MNKKAQIVLLIIVGIMLFAIVVILTLLRESNSTKIIDETTQTIQESQSIDSKINEYVSSCLKQTTEQAILSNGLAGGYFVLPAKATADLKENTAYFLFDNEQLYPSQTVIEKQLALYIDSLVDICLNNFEELKKQGYTITQSKSNSTVIFAKDILLLQTNLPVKIEEETFQKEFPQFRIKFFVTDMLQDFHLATTIIETMNGKEICYSCFSSDAKKLNVTVNIYPLTNKTYLFELIDNDYVINNEKYRFRFGVKHE